jgi:hypothetical protein
MRQSYISVLLTFETEKKFSGNDISGFFETFLEHFIIQLRFARTENINRHGFGKPFVENKRQYISGITLHTNEYRTKVVFIG